MAPARLPTSSVFLGPKSKSLRCTSTNMEGQNGTMNDGWAGIMQRGDPFNHVSGY